MADNVNLIINETIEKVVINPTITTEIVDVNVSGTDTTVDISVTPNLTVVNINQVTGGGGGSDIVVQDEGVDVTTALTGLNFIGNGVTAFKTGGVGDNITVSIPGLIEVVPPLIISGGTDQIISTSVYPGRLMGRADNGSIGPMQEIQVGTGLSLSAGGVLANTSITPVAQGYYGAFQDMLTQTIATANVGQPFLIRTTDENNHITITQNGAGQYTRITPEYTGVYNIQWSGQFQNPTQFIHDVNVWFRKGFTSNTGNGTDIVGSNGVIALPARKSNIAGEQGHTVSGWNFVLTINAGEYVEFYWMSDSTDVTLQSYAAGSPPPSTASLIVTVTQQAGVMAGVTPPLIDVLNNGRVVDYIFYDYSEDPPIPIAGTVMTISNNTFNEDTGTNLGTGIFVGGATGIDARGYGDGGIAVSAFSNSGNAIFAYSYEFSALQALSALSTAINAVSYEDTAIFATASETSSGFGIYARAVNNYAGYFNGGSIGGINVISDGGTLVNIVHNGNSVVGIKSRGNSESSVNHIECYTAAGSTPSFKVTYVGNVETPQLTTDRIYKTQPTIVTITTTPTTLTYTNISTGIIRTAISGAVALTLPTGASMQTMGIPLNKGFDWNIINSSVGTTTLAAALGHTILGSAIIAIGTSATLRTVQTATNTYITYRIN